jgi:hypothetical protein
MPFPIARPLIGTVPLHAALIAVVLFVLTVPIALRLARREGRPWLVPLVLGALGLHFAGSALQIFVVRRYYGNVADFHGYNAQGAELVEAWRDGAWSIGGLDIPGTGSVSILTGLVYRVTGVDQLGGFFVFSWLALLGLVAFYRAFRVALPQGRDGRYAVILFLLPSLWYWPTTAGKEAVMLLALGAMALGAAHLLRSQWRGVVPFAAGALLGAAVRPHEVALVFAAFALAVVTRRITNRSLLTPIRVGGTLLIVLVVGGLLAVVTARFLGITSFGGVAKAVNEANTALQGEGSGFGSSHETWHPSPLYYPVDVYIVLFKPTPLEVTSTTQAIAALENLTIVALVLASWRSLRQVPRYLRESPFVLMCLAYSAVFIYLFSALGNVGLLARERTLLFPFLFVLFALSQLPSRRRARDAARSPTADRRVPASSW